jgi:putative ABC transport system permease protein
VQSFRATVVDWLEMTLDADVYVSSPTMVSSRNDAALDPELVRRLRALDGVAGVNTVRGLLVDTQHGVANLVALEMAPGSERRFHFVAGDARSAWPAFRERGEVLVSEPYAFRHDVVVGDSVIVRGAQGPRAFRIAGVYRDYASDAGTVMMHRSTYRAHFRDEAVSGVGLFLDDPAAVPETIARIHARLDAGDDVLVRSNRDLRETSIEIFDRTFAITNILRLLTVFVAFVGVLSALMALQLERSRELGVLRAIGLTPRQLWRLVTLQTGVMGLFAGIISLPFGVMLAAILVLVVNKRSFGWTLELHLTPEVMVQAMVLALVAALLAGVYPGYRMARTPPARALREE